MFITNVSVNEFFLPFAFAISVIFFLCVFNISLIRLHISVFRFKDGRQCYTIDIEWQKENFFFAFHEDIMILSSSSEWNYVQYILVGSIINGGFINPGFESMVKINFLCSHQMSFCQI